MDEDHPCRQHLHSHICMAFSSTEAVWSHNPITFSRFQGSSCLPLGSIKPVSSSPQPAPHFHPPLVRLGRLGMLMVESSLCSSPRGDTRATHLPSLPARDVTELPGRLQERSQFIFLSPVTSREGL